MRPRLKATGVEPVSPHNEPKTAQIAVWAVAAAAPVLAAIVGLWAAGWPWGAACGLLVGAVASGAACAALSTKTAASPSAPRPLANDLASGCCAGLAAPVRAASAPGYAAPAPVRAASAPSELLLFDATRPIPPLDPNLLALSSADRVARQIQEDTQRFRQGAEAT